MGGGGAKPLATGGFINACDVNFGLG